MTVVIPALEAQSDESLASNQVLAGSNPVGDSPGEREPVFSITATVNDVLNQLFFRMDMELSPCVIPFSVEWLTERHTYHHAEYDPHLDNCYNSRCVLEVLKSVVKHTHKAVHKFFRAYLCHDTIKSEFPNRDSKHFHLGLVPKHKSTESSLSNIRAVERQFEAECAQSWLAGTRHPRYGKLMLFAGLFRYHTPLAVTPGVPLANVDLAGVELFYDLTPGVGISSTIWGDDVVSLGHIANSGFWLNNDVQRRAFSKLAKRHPAYDKGGEILARFASNNQE